MKISRRFCGQFLSAPIPPALELAALLTARGLEVDAIAPAAQASGILLGQITECAPHPNADKLRLCQVDIGAAAPLSIVCGAPNARAGLRVAVAPVGAQVGKTTMKSRAIRGQQSAGMITSAAELGLGADADGILELSATDGDIGDSLDDTLLLQDDILEINVTPNRGDCLSHLGMAREVAAALGCDIIIPQLPAPAAAQADTYTATIDEAARAACPYYACQTVRGANCAAPLPWRLRSLIERCGGRCVSAVVDITNYLMLAYGQPLHAFDLDKLQGDIRVRYAADGERIAVLDGSEITCRANTLLIADAAGGVALGGVMGGADSAISAQTKNILIEGAHFAPDAVAGRARDFKLTSEAAFRFERGVDAALPPFAIAQAAALIGAACGGQAGALTQAGAPPAAAPAIALPPAQIGKTLGIDIGAAQAVESLNRLQITSAQTAQGIMAQPPSWRFDLRLPVDLIEEIVRLHGYADLPETLPAGAAPLPAAASAPIAERARDFFAARGFYEIITYAFVPPAQETALGAAAPLPLQNPMSEDMSVMRTTLWGGLLDRALFNLRQEPECLLRGIRREPLFLFEIGRCFLSPDEAGQPALAAGIMLGEANWGALATFEDVKQIAADFLRALGINAAQMQFAPLAGDSADKTAPSALRPECAASILVDGVRIGAAGELRADNPQRAPFGKNAPLLFSLNLDHLSGMAAAAPPPAATAQAATAPTVKYRPFSRLPRTRRDVTIWHTPTDAANNDAIAQKILAAAAQEIAGQFPFAGVALADHYVAPDKIKYTLRFLLQGTEANLTADQINAAQRQIAAIATNAILPALPANAQNGADFPPEFTTAP